MISLSTITLWAIAYAPWIAYALGLRFRDLSQIPAIITISAAFLIALILLRAAITSLEERRSHLADCWILILLAGLSALGN